MLGSERPPKPRLPIERKFRRVMPSQYRWLAHRSRIMLGPLLNLVRPAAFSIRLLVRGSASPSSPVPSHWNRTPKHFQERCCNKHASIIVRQASARSNRFTAPPGALHRPSGGCSKISLSENNASRRKNTSPGMPKSASQNLDRHLARIFLGGEKRPRLGTRPGFQRPCWSASILVGPIFLRGSSA